MDGDAPTLEDIVAREAASGRKTGLSPNQIKVGIAVVVGLLLIVLAARWLADRMSTVSTNDARIAADMVAVATDVSGRITEKRVSSGDAVRIGDVIYAIDDRAARYRLAELEADVARLKAEIDRESARIGLSSSKFGSTVAAREAESLAAVAAVESAKVDLQTAQREFDRTEGLFKRGLVTEATYDAAANTLNAAQLTLAQAKAQVEKTGADRRTALVERDEVSLIEHDLKVLQASLLQAEARVEGQRVRVDQHQIRSPINGIVDELFYDEGEHSLQGFRMALLHDPGAVWVSANIKENEVRHILAGARAEVRPDSAPGQMVEGAVGQVSNLTVAEAALMPNPNASGVFTKITQRVEVRIDLPNNDLNLKPGTMVRVKIDKSSDGGSNQ